MKHTIKKSLLVISLLMGANSFASIDKVIPTKNAEQKEFAELIQRGQFETALMAWPTALGSTAFAQSDSGVALQALLMAKSGLPTMAAAWVVRDTNRNKVDATLQKEWIAILKTQSPQVLNMANNSWNLALENKNVIFAKNKNDIKKLQQRLNKTPKSNVSERAILYWSIGTQGPRWDYLNTAIGALKSLKEMHQDVIGEDQIQMALARALYQNNQLNEAIVEYSQMSKSSDMWIESVEERAWAYVRLNEYDKATADITTLLTPTFADLVGPEVYFLANLTALKICDYPRVLQNGKKFKDRNQDRIREIEMLAQKGTNSKINEILNEMDAKGVSLKSVGSRIKSMPRLALRSEDFSGPATLRHQLLSEITKAQSLTKKFSVVGSNQSLNGLMVWAQAQAEKSKDAALRELKTLAKSEVKEYREMLNKLKLAEVEVIHHFSVDDNLKGKRGDIQELSKGSNTLVFPYDDEVWMDELDNYQARVKDCPTAKGASL